MHYSIFVQDGDRWVRVFTHADPKVTADAFLKSVRADDNVADVAVALEHCQCVSGYDRNGNHGLMCAENSPYRPAKVVTR